MSEFVVKIEDEIVQVLGKQAIENYLQAFITQTILKVSAADILKDYDNESLSEDKIWSAAKKSAFLNDRNSQYIKVSANV
jgi:hypothetical protein